MRIELPQNVKNIIEQLNKAGFEAYAVGGCVRDTILGRVPNDWDITTSAKPEKVKEIFKRTVDTGLKHGTVTVLVGKEGYEVTTYRVDGEYEDGRHPNSVEFTKSLEEDLLRRDFTINAMAYNDTDGLVDIFGGIEDIEKKVIRCVGNPKERFTEDALRLLRAIRFAAQLGYEIETDTYDAIKELASTLQKISAERIQVELVKTITSDHPEMIRTAYELGLTKVFLPEIDKCFETKQNNPHHCYSVGNHIVKTMEVSPKDRIIRLTLLLHDIGKPVCKTTDEDGIDHFHGHPEKSKEMAVDILRRLKFDNDTIGMVGTLVSHHDERIEPGETNMRRIINKVGVDAFPIIFDIWEADIKGQSDYMKEEKFERLSKNREDYKEIVRKKDCVDLKSLKVSGRDLIEAGMEPGPRIGEMLNKMLEEVIDNPELNEKEYLMKKYVGQK